MNKKNINIKDIICCLIGACILIKIFIYLKRDKNEYNNKR